MIKIVPIVVICLSVSLELYGQGLQKLKDGVSIKGENYYESEYIIEYMKFKIDTVTIETAQVFGNASNSKDDIYCRAIIQTKSKQGIIDELYFKSIEAVGSSYGICFTKNQINKNYVIGSKYGDYSGLLIIIDSSGMIMNEPGGNYFTSGNRYLISNWYSDLSGITIFDMGMNKIVYSKELPVYISKWHNGKGKFFVAEWDGEREINNIYRLDLMDFTFSKTELDLSDLYQLQIVKTIGCAPN